MQVAARVVLKSPFSNVQSARSILKRNNVHTATYIITIYNHLGHVSIVTVIINIIICSVSRVNLMKCDDNIMMYNNNDV